MRTRWRACARQILDLQADPGPRLRGDGVPRRLRGNGGQPDAAPLSRGAGQRDLGRQRQRPVSRYRARDSALAPNARSVFRRGLLGEGRKRRARRPCRGAQGGRAELGRLRGSCPRSLRPARGRFAGGRALSGRLAGRGRLLPLAHRTARGSPLWRADRGRYEGDREARRAAVSPSPPNPSPIARRETGVLPNALWGEGSSLHARTITFKRSNPNGAPLAMTQSCLPVIKEVLAISNAHSGQADE